MAESVELARELIAGLRIIEQGNGIREVERLVSQYGGRKAKWVKKSSPAFEREGTLFEYRCYGHHGIGRVETKKANHTSILPASLRLSIHSSLLIGSPNRMRIAGDTLTHESSIRPV
jgi:hypothetical protein